MQGVEAAGEGDQGDGGGIGLSWAVGQYTSPPTMIAVFVGAGFSTLAGVLLASQVFD